MQEQILLAIVSGMLKEQTTLQTLQQHLKVEIHKEKEDHLNN
jgi:hypothetical protein